MRVTYDPEVDVLRILLSNAPIEESDEDKPGVILDYDKDGNIVGLEILELQTSPIPLAYRARALEASNSRPKRSNARTQNRPPQLNTQWLGYAGVTSETDMKLSDAQAHVPSSSSPFQSRLSIKRSCQSRRMWS